MSKDKIIKAWKSEQYRHTLSAAEQAQLPGNPAGIIELEEAGLSAVAGTEEAVTFLIFCASFDLDCDATIFNGSCKLWTHGCCTAIDTVA